MGDLITTIAKRPKSSGAVLAIIGLLNILFALKFGESPLFSVKWGVLTFVAGLAVIGIGFWNDKKKKNFYQI